MHLIIGTSKNESVPPTAAFMRPTYSFEFETLDLQGLY